MYLSFERQKLLTFGVYSSTAFLASKVRRKPSSWRDDANYLYRTYDAEICVLPSAAPSLIQSIQIIQSVTFRTFQAEKYSKIVS